MFQMSAARTCPWLTDASNIVTFMDVSTHRCFCSTRASPNTDTTDILSPAIHAGSALRDIKRDSGGNGSFLSSAHNGSYSPPARTFGSTVASAGPLASASQSQLINSSPTILGGSMLWQAMPTPGSNLSRGWGAGDPISPSKLLSASPTGGK